MRLCEECGERFPAEPNKKHPERLQRWCRECWQARLAQRETDSKLAGGIGLAASFPLGKAWVNGKRVCVGYQLGSCVRTDCPDAHVCHGCGVRHHDGSLCSAAIRAVDRWRAELVRQRKAGRR